MPFTTALHAYSSATGGGGPTIYIDTFPGVNGTILQNHPLDTGQAWIHAAYQGITDNDTLNGSGQVLPAGDPVSYNPYLVNVVNTPDKQVVQMDWTPGTTSDGCAMIARSNNAADNPAYDDIQGGCFGDERWTLQQFSTGRTARTSVIIITPGQTYTIKLEVLADDTVNLYINSVLTVTDSFPGLPAGGTYVGMFIADQGVQPVGLSKGDNYSAAIG